MSQCDFCQRPTSSYDIKSFNSRVDVGMSENWWHAGIMPCVRSDLERDKPVAYTSGCSTVPSTYRR